MSRISKLFLVFCALAGWEGNRLAHAAPGYSVEIDLGDQRAYLLRGGEVVHETPISSGRPGYATPTGNFRILDKDIDYRSSLYGKIVDAQGRTVVADAESDMPVPAGGRFVNAPMPYFMRFNGGIGMHAGYLPGYAASHGCVRMPEESARLFFSAVEPGTPVTVFGSAPAPRARVVQRAEERRWQEREERRRESGLARVLLRPFRWRSSTWD
jgi:hypothetical protein